MKKKILNLFGNLLLLICLYFIGSTLMQQDIDWAIYLTNPVNIFWYIIIILTYIWVLWAKAILYKDLLKVFTENLVDNFLVIKMYVVSNLGKYLPGNVMHFVGRNVLSTKYSIPQVNITLSTILEILIILISSVVIAFLLGFQYFYGVVVFIFENYLSFFLVLVALGLVGVTLITIFAYKNKEKVLPFIQLFNKKENRNVMFRVFIGNCIVNIVTGITYMIVVRSIQPDVSINLSVIGIYLLAWLVGFVMPGAPGGIGIRESILLLLLVDLMPTSIVLVVTLVHRVLNIIAELISFLLIKGYKKKWFYDINISND